jgi:predicted alpha/beta hydrolase family esterase
MPAAPEQSVLLLHGWQNHRPAGHWQHELATDLTAAGVDVSYPALPDPDHPDRAAWSTRTAAEFDALTGRRRTVVAHSLAVWVVLELLSRDRLRDADRVLLVAPVARAVLAANPPIAGFDPGLDDKALAAAITGTDEHLVASDDDPYWPGGAADWAESLGATVHPLTGQGHLALGDGYGRWDSVRQWLTDTSGRTNGVRIEPR